MGLCLPDNDVRDEALLDRYGCIDLMLVPGLAFTLSGERLGR
jgi:5-formyltetrahydrofolate cyclo-ligase